MSTAVPPEPPPPPTASAKRIALVLAAFLASGAAGLVYEVVWTRLLTVLVGGTAVASQVVLATFFGGSTLGALALGGRAARARDGARFYARLELALAAAGLASGALLAAARGPAARATDGAEGAQTAFVALVVAAIACLPATFAMGATFPAATRAVTGLAAADARSARLMGLAYGANTAGAVAGALLASFGLLPLAGVWGTLLAAVAANLAAAGLAFAAGRDEPAVAPAPAEPERGGSSVRLGIAAALAGFAALSLEVVALRVLAVTLRDTVYTFALAVAGYVAGVALGAWIYARWLARARIGLAPLFGALALASAAWLPAVRWGSALLGGLRGARASFFDTSVVEGAAAAWVALPLAIPTTIAFLALAQRLGPHVASGARAATAWNGLGCAVAPLVSALVLLPRFGAWGVAAAGVLALAACVGLLLPDAAPRQRLAGAALAFAALVPLAFVQGGVHAWYAAPGWTIVWRREGASAAVAVEQAPDGRRRVRTNNGFAEGGDGGAWSQLRQGLLPTLFVPEGRRVLVLGVGSGITLAGAVGGLPDATFDAVELLPEVRHALGFFARANGDVARRFGVELHVADARTFAAHQAARGEAYDLVVGELFHATQAGTGALYAREHFEAIRKLVGARGRYAQWVPLHEAPAEEVRTIVRTFFGVFPHGGAFLGGWGVRTALLGLIGGAAPLELDADATLAWLDRHPERAARARQSEIARLDEVLATWVADAEAMRRWAGPGPENTDARPELELYGPRHARDAMGLENVRALLGARSGPPAFVTWGARVTEAQVVALSRSASLYFGALAALERGDGAAAERTLRDAIAASPLTAPRTVLERLAATRGSLPER